MIKKTTFLIGVLQALLLVSTAHAAGLSDIAASNNRTAIQYLYDQGVISGYPDGTFRPDNTLNRAELLKILVNGQGVRPTLADGYKNCFPDVREEWFAPYICYAKAQKWVSGYPDGTFQPAKTVSKVEAVKMLINSQEWVTPATVAISPFADVNPGGWYAPYIKTAWDWGVLEETGGIYGVNSGMTRGGISESIYRAMTIRYYDVVKVVDGDTISVDVDGESQTVRMIGLDTPETVDPRKPVQCFGMEASNRAKSVLTGAKVMLRRDTSQGDVDKYGRLLRYVFLRDGTNFNKMMIESGYGREYTYDSAYQYQAEFRQAELDAQNNGKGLWADNACADPADETPVTEPGDTTVPDGSDSINASGYYCTTNLYNCSDFSTHASAQAVFDKCLTETGTDIHRLDSDGDLNVCESLP